MDIDELRRLYDTYERRGANYPRFRREESETVVRMIALDEGEHCTVIFSSLNEVNADAAIEGELEYFARIGRRFEWKLFSHDDPPDLKAR
ncbi:MAG TPA: N-acetyltransferase, partial [Spirochaetaceae bacterium]|nr:N-acetyltransferase [Spirochaetaceae bacterium]